jgi:hypothetical protein
LITGPSASNAQRLVISDTGFLLSVAATDLLLPVLEERWQGRALWPQEVNSELVYRVQRPGRGVTVWLAKRALACGQKLAGSPEVLTPEQQRRAALLAAAIGGLGSTEHAGESAAAILASDKGGVLATEDGAAASIIHATEGVESITIVNLLRQLHAKGQLSENDLVQILVDLQKHNRPYTDGMTVQTLLGT